MLKRLQFLRGNTSATSSFTGLVGELTVNTSDWSIHVHDGSTAGGTKLATQDYVTGVASGIDAGQIASLTANAAVQAGQIASLTANAAVQAGELTTLTGTITTANTAMKGYVDAQITSIGAHYSDSDVQSYLDGNVSGNIIPSANVTYSLGDPTHQWKDLYISSNTIHIGGDELSISSGNLTINGNILPTVDQVNDLIEVVTYDQDLNTTNDVTFANIVTSTGQLSVPTDTSFALRLNDSTFGEANLIVDSQGYMTLTGGITTRFYNVVKDGELIGGLGWNGNIVQLDALNGFNITTGVEGTGGVWSFGTDGGLTLPGGGLLGQVWDDGIDTELTLKSPPGVGDSGYVALSSANERNYVEVSNIGVVLGVEFDTEGFKTLTFGTDGGLTLPNGAVIKDNADSSVSFGGGAGATDQGAGAVAIGEGAGNNTQSNQAVAIGRGSGNYQQGVGAIGVGFCAGATEQGDYAVAIGFKAARGNMDGDGTPNQPANSIMINASSTPLNGDQAGLYINPVREDTGNTAKAIYYNTTTKELTYADPTGGGGDVLTSDNANITVTIANAVTPGNTLTWTFDTDGFVYLPEGGVIGDIFGEGMTGIQANTSDSNSYASIVSHDYQNALDADSNGVRILTDDSAQGGNSTQEWRFDRSGNLTFPDMTVQTTAWNSNANVAIIGYVDSAVSTANTAMKGYVDDAVSTANSAVVGYIDSVSYNSSYGDSNVAAYTGNISAQVNGYDIGYRDIPQVSAGNVTLALADRGKHYYSTSTAPLTLTVPSNANVAFPIGTAISIVNKGSANLTVALEAEASMYLAGNATSASRTITTYGMATLMKTATDEWFINGTGVS